MGTEEALIEQGGQAVFGYLFKKLQRLDGKNTWETTDEVIREGMRRQFVGIVTQFVPISVLSWITANPEAAKGLASGEMVSVPTALARRAADMNRAVRDFVRERDLPDNHPLVIALAEIFA